MNAHTPGPWSFGHLGMDALWVGPDYMVRPVCTVPHDTDPDARDESRANAALLAAAPELLDALEQALEQAIFPGVSISDAYNNARAAIAKAKGTK